jgi:hypothetical protein
LIYPGQRLKIPTACGGSTTTSTTGLIGPWTVKYWTNRNLNGTPVLTRTDNTVNFNWDQGCPTVCVGCDNFSARWTRTHNFSGGTYRFHAEVDDGVRVWVDDILIIDQWHVTSVKHYTADWSVGAGNHSLRIDYYEQTGLARIKFWIERISSTVVPPPATTWTAEYYNNTSLTPPWVIARTETQPIDYDWGEGGPFASFPVDNFSVRWVKNASFEQGTYRFTVNVDDGVVVRIDGTPIIDEWHQANNATYVKDVNLSQGTHEVRVRYYEGTGAAKIKVSWAKVTSGAGPWAAKYYQNQDLTGSPAITRSDNAINFDWGSGSPGSPMTGDNFSAEWNGDFSFAGGTYRFTATADDGIRVWIDDNQIINEWHISSVRTYWAELSVPAGVHHVKVRYFENNGLAVAKVSWAKQ